MNAAILDWMYHSMQMAEARLQHPRGADVQALQAEVAARRAVLNALRDGADVPQRYARWARYMERHAALQVARYARHLSDDQFSLAVADARREREAVE